jgi:hypothetical protein
VDSIGREATEVMDTKIPLSFASIDPRPSKIRTFETGATRDTDADKYDYEGFLSPLVVERYGRYMHKHRTQSDGTLRASDNWQRGIPREQYMKSLFRHVIDLWQHHRAGNGFTQNGQRFEAIEDLCCAVMFNVMGYLHEYLRGR